MDERRIEERRRFLSFFASMGLGSSLLPGVLWAKLEEGEARRIDKSMLEDAERLAGLEFTEAERELMVEGLNDKLGKYETLRAVPLANSLAPALRFDPLPPGTRIPQGGSSVEWSRPDIGPAPRDLEEVAFWPVARLAELIRTRAVRSTALTEMYLRRLKRYGAKLECVVTLTEDLALRQAARADEEIAAGRIRGPLHGIPWGAKDLLAVRGYPTTWGARPFKDQRIEEDATVVRRLEEAGAVLVAKLTLGALAWGDVWFGGRTRNPWNLEEGSSGSSAGSAAATSAGLVGFSIGSETWGSIVSPSTRCGVTGLRPTFGRVSRHGAMALSWSMDKIGPICREVEDCAMVLEAIRGPDKKDGTAVDAPFRWDPRGGIDKLRVGYIEEDFEAVRDAERKKNDTAALEALRGLGIEPRPIRLPDLPVEATSFILGVEAAAAFDDLTRSGRDDLLVRQGREAWPNVFREMRLVPAVEYLQANRVRMLLIEAMDELFRDLDVYVAPSLAGRNLLVTNLSGHPAVVVPTGSTEAGSLTSITFTGRLFGEGAALAVAKAYQDATGFHRKHPALDG